MKFIKDRPEKAAQAVAGKICGGLHAGQRVLWLTSGGSNIAVQKAVMGMVRDHAEGRLSCLAILPMDERYGRPGHKDSNVRQLREAGFDPGEATFVDVLMHDLPFEQTVSFYNDVTATALANADVIVGQFGMGPDGHIAGIKPDSPATVIDAATVIGYAWDDYTRMTLTPIALEQVTTAFLITYGADRRDRLVELKKKGLPFAKLPVMLLYELPEVYIFNDQLGARTKA